MDLVTVYLEFLPLVMWIFVGVLVLTRKNLNTRDMKLLFLLVWICYLMSLTRDILSQLKF